MSNLTDHEQLVLEMINRARLDPAAEAQRLGISLNQGLNPGQISASSKQPLAHNTLLNNAASTHSNWMLQNNVFSHTGAGGSDPGDRIEDDAGYRLFGSWTWGENIAWNGTTGSLNLLQSTISAHNGLFRSAGHRLNILNGNFKEVGIGGETGNFSGYNAFMLTENFAKSGFDNFLTGVVYTDNNRDQFYSVGEGRGSVSIAFSNAGSNIGSTSTWAAGGYTFGTTTTGPIVVTFSGGGLSAPVSVTVIQGNLNTKIDLVGTNLIESSASTILGQNVVTLKLLGLNNLNGTGNNLDNAVIGNSGNNVLNGAAGNDTVIGGPGHDTLIGGSGADALYGQSGIDTVSYAGSAAGVTVKLWNNYVAGGDAQGDTISGFERIIGSDSGDVLVGNVSANAISGGAGNDVIISGAGNDYLSGGPGADILFGQSGIDTLSYAGSSAGVVVKLWNGSASGGNAQGDRISSIERLIGSSNNDVLVGDANANLLHGSDGEDVLIGGAGHDYIIGGSDDDDLYGQSGIDTFLFGPSSGDDVIHDYLIGQDQININALLDNGLNFDQSDVTRVNGNDALVNLGGGNTITVSNVNPVQLYDDIADYNNVV